MLPLFLLLALVQGLAEFLPISSSGHLRILQALFGLKDPLTVVDVLLHLGTLVSVLIVYRAEVARLTVAGLRLLARPLAAPERIRSDPDARLLALVTLATLPTTAIALTLGGLLDRAAAHIAFVGGALIVNGGILWLLDVRSRRLAAAPHLARPLSALTARDALLIGVAQGLAITRGISRSGSTITAGVVLGLRQDAAATFSFLLAIPAIVGAVILHLSDLSPSDAEHVPLALVAAVLAGLVGYVALRWLLGLLDRGRLGLFASYSALVGLVTLVWSLVA
jgi:undecaprenyl-diphosphatase